MNTRPTSTPAARLLLAAMLAASASSLHAANGTWNATATDGNWTTAANWAGSTIPGAAIPTGTGSNNVTNTDVVTFNAESNFSTIAIDSRFINSILFDTGAGAYTFTGGLLALRTGGSITMNAGVTNAQVFSNTWQVRQNSSANGTYSFINNSTTESATLTFNAATNTLTNANGRPTTLTLGGANTGANTISSNLTNAAGTQAVNIITKTGTGTWVLSGANTFTGTGATAVANGIQINGGTLVAANNAALGSSGTANANQVSINSTGTLRIDSGITLDNGLSLNLNNGGTLRANGTAATNGRVNLTTTAASSATLSTTSSGDVFTIGNAANDLTGGAADTVINVSGPGTLSLGFASNYLGSWSLNAGTVQLGSATALGSGSIAFGSGSTATLQLKGQNVTTAGLNSHATVGTPVIENGTAGSSTLTVNTTGTSTSTYAGTVQDGAAGTLAITKSGTGTLALNGANTYSGGTSITGGTLRANNSSGSATGSGTVSVANSGTLGGSGSISGLVSVASGGIVAPGNSVGTLTVGSLTAAAGSIFNFEFNSSPANDKINVTSNDGLTLNGGGFNLYTENTLNGWTTTGDYNLIQYAGSIQGTGIGALSVLNPQAGYGYTFGTSGGYVTLNIFIAAVLSHWNVDADGSWGTSGNWNAVIPNGVGEGAIFDKALTSPATVTLDGAKTVGGLTFDSANGYTLAPGAGGSLSMNSGVSQSSIIVSSGSHAISAPVGLASNTVASVASGSALTVSGQISGTGSLTKSGTGSLDLDTANIYSGGTSITGGTVGFVAGGLGSGAVAVDGASLVYKGVNTDDLSAQGLSIGSGGASIDIGANNVAYTAAITGSGSFTKGGSGTLTLQGNNTFTGATTVNGGALVLNGSSASTGGTTLNGANTAIELAGDSSLGAVPGSPTVNLTLNPGSGNTASVKFNAATTLAANRNISLASGSGLLDTNGNAVTVSGALSGSGNLVKNGVGVLTLGSAAVSATGTTTINDGGITTANINALPSGAITLNNNATLSLTANSAQTVGNLTVNGSNTITAGNTNTIFSVGTIVGGSGSLTVNGGSFVNDFTGSWNGFTGSIALGGTGGYRFFGNTGSADVAFDLGTRGISVRSTATGITLGSLTGQAGSSLNGSGGGATQAVTYTIGAKNLSTAFAGTINNGTGLTSLTKVGTGTLTLSGTNTYTGTTTISAGTLALGANDVFANTSPIVLNGGTLAAATFTDTLGTLDLDANSSITFGTGGMFIFADSSSLESAWGTFTLSIGGNFVNGSSIRFGTTGGGLTPAQLALININGLAATIDSNGYLSAVPEPASFAALAGLGMLGFAASRRRRRSA